MIFSSPLLFSHTRYPGTLVRLNPLRLLVTLRKVEAARTTPGEPGILSDVLHMHGEQRHCDGFGPAAPRHRNGDPVIFPQPALVGDLVAVDEPDSLFD